jgi:hypothetical protein
VKIQSTLQLDYGESVSKTPKISLFDDREKRNQDAYSNPRVRREGDSDHVHDMRVDVHNLITGNECSGEPENKAQSDDEPVIKLNQEISREDSSGVNEFTADPVKPNVQNENEGNESKQTPITLEDGKLIIDQLLNLGYHIDPNSGPDINQIYFNYQLCLRE